MNGKNQTKLETMIGSFNACTLKRKDSNGLRNISIQSMAAGFGLRSFAWKVILSAS